MCLYTSNFWHIGMGLDSEVVLWIWVGEWMFFSAIPVCLICLVFVSKASRLIRLMLGSFLKLAFFQCFSQQLSFACKLNSFWLDQELEVGTWMRHLMFWDMPYTAIRMENALVLCIYFFIMFVLGISFDISECRLHRCECGIMKFFCMLLLPVRSSKV